MTERFKRFIVLFDEISYNLYIMRKFRSSTWIIEVRLLRKYLNIPCVHCNHKFEEMDDVVVCPICGAPHHRSCYREAGHCALAEKHSDDYLWQPPAEKHPHGHTVVCPDCNTVNLRTNAHCQKCNKLLAPRQGSHTPHNSGRHSLDPVVPGRDAFEQTSALHRQNGEENADGTAQEQGDITPRELSAYLGSSSFYFVRQFKRLKDNHRRPTWNLCAFLFSYFYFAYRKMYRLALLLAAFFVITNIPIMLYTIEFFKAQYAPEWFGVTLPYNAELLDVLLVLIPIVNLLRFAVSLLCGLFANSFFFKQTLVDIDNLKTGKKTFPFNGDFYMNLFLSGRPNRVVVILLLGVHLAFYSSLGSYLVSLVGL